MTTLVTGGAGYIGAHVVRALEAVGRETVIVDDLSADRAHSPAGPANRIDLASSDAAEALELLMRERGVTSVVHLAARKSVAESVARPAWYFQQNVGGLSTLLLAMERAAVPTLVFSSSAAVYGEAPLEPITEDAPAEPVNPYGDSKLVGERLVRWAVASGALRAASLRYFNVAGTASADLVDTGTANLIPLALGAIARGERPTVFGDDYPTPDGTCVRDYVHVADLAEAHVAVLDALESGREISPVFNVGTGSGSSVRKVIERAAAITGLPIEPLYAPRRAGDPPAVVGDVSLIERELGWRARLGLEDMLRSAWDARPTAD